MTDFTHPLVDRLAAVHDESPREGPVVELAVGRRPAVARALADRGIEVVATDLREREVPDPVAFVRDDLTDPDEAIYAGATLLYARNLPAELQRPAATLAAAVDAPCFFTTLGAEEPVIPVERESLPGKCGPGEVGPGQCGPGEVGPGQCGPGEVGPGQCGPGEVGPGETLYRVSAGPGST